MATYLAPFTRQQFFAPNGQFLSYGQIFTYEAGSSTPAATWIDSTGITENTNPIVLDANGSASIWLPANVSYKFNIVDQFGNQLPGYPVDNIVVNLLLNLFGGTDTGIANNYILSYSSPYASYTNGEIIYWIPANTNTGPSTINVNGLGPVPILNINGSPLVPGQIVANSISGIIYTNGIFQLLAVGTILGGFGLETTIVANPTTDLGTALANVVNINGATTITSFGSSASTSAPIYVVRFTGTPLLTNSATLILPGNANIQAFNGDAMLAEYLGSSTWKVLSYWPYAPLVQSVGAIAIAQKSSATSRASITTVLNDPDLLINIPTAGSYIVEFWINDFGSTSAGGLKGGINFTGTFSNGYWSMNGVGTGVTPFPTVGIGFVNAQLESAQNGVGSMMITGGLICGTSGTLAFQWAQEFLNANPSIVGIGSWMRVTRVK